LLNPFMKPSITVLASNGRVLIDMSTLGSNMVLVSGFGVARCGEKRFWIEVIVW
jgi:hypothetical protein